MNESGSDQVLWSVGHLGFSRGQPLLSAFKASSGFNGRCRRSGWPGPPFAADITCPCTPMSAAEPTQHSPLSPVLLGQCEHRAPTEGQERWVRSSRVWSTRAHTPVPLGLCSQTQMRLKFTNPLQIQRRQEHGIQPSTGPPAASARTLNTHTHVHTHARTAKRPWDSGHSCPCCLGVWPLVSGCLGFHPTLANVLPE